MRITLLMSLLAQLVSPAPKPGHAAILAFAIGNEIPPSIVRWYGRRRVERFLGRLWRAVKDEDDAALVTYVNFPSTEYLRLPFLDFVCFNVYLESREKFEAYLYRLHTLAGRAHISTTHSQAVAPENLVG